MHRTRWTKWYWGDWLTDYNIQRSSLAAQGFWMEILCYAGTGDRVGHVNETDDELIKKIRVLRMPPGTREATLWKYLAELERNGVFKRNRRGRIYCPRMVRDDKNLQAAIDSGRKGGRASRDRKKGIFRIAEGPSDAPSRKPSG